MGQSAAGCLIPCGGSALAHAPVVAVGEVSGRGALPVSSRYCCTRSLDQDFAVADKVLGTGMNGSVRLAMSRFDGRPYAVKSFRKAGVTPAARKDLKSEAEIYLSLDHPHVARLEMVYETKEEVHLVMEHMAGGELFDRLHQRKVFSEDDAAEALRQMLLAVNYLHAHRIAHRDLKLENFLYVSPDSDHLKLIDFGFAQSTEESKKMSQACGSLHYVAPEVLAKAYTDKADLWSIGVIAYMLLTGSPPFFGSDEAVLRKIRRGEVYWGSRFAGLSAEARDFLRSLLVVDPCKRLSALEALEHPWIKARSETSPGTINMETVECFKTFSDASKFHRNVLSMMAWSLSDEDREELRSQFLCIDADNNGTISLSEFTDAMLAIGDMSEHEAVLLFQRLDTDSNQELEYSEFLAAAALVRRKVSGESLRKLFSRMDRDGDGQIGRQELRTVFGASFSDRDFEELLKEADTSGDGKLDFDEFCAHFAREAAAPGRRGARRALTAKLGEVLNGLVQSSRSLTQPAAAEPADETCRRLPSLLGKVRRLGRPAESLSKSKL